MKVEMLKPSSANNKFTGASHYDIFNERVSSNMKQDKSYSLEGKNYQFYLIKSCTT